MNYRLMDSIGLHAACVLSMNLQRLKGDQEYLNIDDFDRRVLRTLVAHNVYAADLRRPVIGDGIWTLLQYLRRNPAMPWSILILLHDWDSRFASTGYDFVLEWYRNEGTQGH